MANAEIGALRVSLSADTAAFSTGLKRATAATEAAARQIETRLSTMTSVVSGFLGGSVGGAGMQLLQQLPKAVRAVVAEGAGLVDMAAKLGVTTDALQELHFVATQGGASIADFDKSLQVFVKQLGLASAGSGELFKVLEANGVALRDQQGNMRPVLALLTDYAELLRRASSEQERAALSAIAFGRGGADLANVFRDGAAGVNEAVDAFHELGGAISQSLLKRVADIDDRFDAFSTTIGVTFRSEVLKSVVAVDDLINRMEELNKQNDWNIGHKLQAAYQDRQAVVDRLAELNADLEDPFRSAMLGKAKIELDIADAEAQLKTLTDQAMQLRDILDRRNGYEPDNESDGDLAPGVPIPRQRPVVVPGSGGGGGNGSSRKSDAERQRESLQVRLEQLQASLLTERQAELDSYATRMTDLNDFLDQGLLSKQSYAEMALAVEADHAAKMQALDKETADEAARNAQRRMDALNVMADSVSSVLGSLFGESKAAAYAQTVIATAQAVMQTYAQLGGGPWAVAAAMSVAAAGAAQLATIARTTKDGGGSKPSAASAAVAAPSGGDTQGGSTSTLFVQGISRDQLFSGDAVRDLAQKLLDYQADGGKVVIS